MMEDRLEEIRRRRAEIRDELSAKVPEVESLLAENEKLADEEARLLGPPRRRLRVVKGDMAAFAVAVGTLAAYRPHRAVLAATSSAVVAGMVVALAVGAPPKVREGTLPPPVSAHQTAPPTYARPRRRAPRPSGSPSLPSRGAPPTIVELAALPVPGASSSPSATGSRASARPSAAPIALPTVPTVSAGLTVSAPPVTASFAVSPTSVAPSLSTPSGACLVDLKLQRVIAVCVP